MSREAIDLPPVRGPWVLMTTPVELTNTTSEGTMHDPYDTYEGGRRLGPGLGRIPNPLDPAGSPPASLIEEPVPLPDDPDRTAWAEAAIQAAGSQS